MPTKFAILNSTTTQNHSQNFQKIFQKTFQNLAITFELNLEFSKTSQNPTKIHKEQAGNHLRARLGFASTPRVDPCDGWCGWDD